MLEFYLLLAVHLGIILVNNQLDAQFFFVYVYFSSLYVSSTHVLIIRRINCIEYDIWYMSLYVGDRLVCRFGWSSIQTCTLDGHLHRATCTRCRIDTIDFPDDEHMGT